MSQLNFIVPTMSDKWSEKMRTLLFDSLFVCFSERRIAGFDSFAVRAMAGDGDTSNKIHAGYHKTAGCDFIVICHHDVVFLDSLQLDEVVGLVVSGSVDIVGATEHDPHLRHPPEKAFLNSHFIVVNRGKIEPTWKPWHWQPETEPYWSMQYGLLDNSMGIYPQWDMAPNKDSLATALCARPLDPSPFLSHCWYSNPELRIKQGSDTLDGYSRDHLIRSRDSWYKHYRALIDEAQLSRKVGS